MLPSARLRKQYAHGDATQFIQPAGKHAAILSRPAMEVRSARSAVMPAELQVYPQSGRPVIIAFEKGAISIGTLCAFALASSTHATE